MTNLSNFNPEKVNQQIVDWLRNYALQAKANGFVVGISGGVDSALTSTLCAQTGLKVVCIEMPIHQHQSHVSRGQEHIDQLIKRFPNVTSVVTNLTNVFESFKEEVSDSFDLQKLEITLANTRARLRMTTLYYHAGVQGLLVAGTGNKVEDFGVGFYTKYGDGGVDLSPIADLMKSEVFALASYLQVPTAILKAAPSDGLFGAEKTDEQQLGATYDELEWAMNSIVKNENQNNFNDRQKEVFAIYKRLNAANQHKMNPIPVCKIH